MAARAAQEGWQAARMVAGVAGAFLLWRGVFGRGRGRLLSLVAGALILGRVLPSAAALAIGRGSKGRRGREVIEVKSPAELEPGFYSASPAPTIPDRADRPGHRT